MVKTVMTTRHRNNWASKLELLHQAAIAVAGAHDVEEALQQIADAARQVSGAQMAAIGVPGEPGEPMAHFVVAGVPAHVHKMTGQAPMGFGVLGVLLKRGEPVRVADIQEHEAFEGLPAHHPGITSFLGVPVQSGGEIIGDLYLANKIAEEEFSEEDQQLAEMLAAHAAVSIQSLRYHHQQEEMAVVRAKASLAPKIEDDVLQALYGAGLLLGTLNVDNPDAARSQVQDVQARLDSAIKHLRSHLLSMAADI